MEKFRQYFRIVLVVFAAIFMLGFMYGCSCNKKYATISFETNGGTAVSSIKVKKGDIIGELPTTIKENYEFVGWFTENDGGIEITSEYIVEKNMKLYAHYTDKEYLTITYDANGGIPVSDVKVKKGDKLGSLPFTDKIGYSFLGWFTSNDGNIQVYEDDIVYTDMTLYACYEKQSIDTVLPEFTEVSIDTDDNYHKIMIMSNSKIDERNLANYVGINALYGELPKLRVVKDGDYYSLLPIGGYQTSGIYVLKLLSDDVEFVNLNIEYENDNLSDKQIKTVNLSIIGKEVSKVEYKDGIIEIAYNDIKLANEDSIVVNKDIYENLPLQINSIVHITSKDINNDFYVKVSGVKRLNNDYIISYNDCDVDEVYEEFNFNANEISAINERLASENKMQTDEMLKELVDLLYDSEGTTNLTKMLANALNASPTVRQYTAQDSNNSFSYADRITDKTGVNITVESLLEDLKITATLGSAKNPNFNGISIPALNDDRWTMLQLNFEYEGTLKNKVKLEASITITQYLYVWFSFNSDSSSGNFKVEATPFSQTDIEFKVLICSADEEEDENDEKEEKKDISIEISNLVNGEGDSSNIIQDVQEMLENKGDAIELCKVPLFQASYVFGGVISLNFDLNFVIKVSFAAGVKIEASILEATTIGVSGNYKTKEIDSYRRVTNGSDRYVFDFYAYGYLGVKAGIEGEITISFTCLKSVLRAGVGVEIGAYADLYGYLHYHAEERRVFKDIDTNGRHFQTLEGGVYFEMGIYLELKAFIGVGKKEFGVSKEFKFKLLEAGDKYLYVEPALNEDLKIIFNETDDDTLNLEGIIPAEGKFLNIVTGEVVTKTLPAKNIRIVSLSNIYKSDNENKQILINREKLDKRTENIPSGKIALYYKGPNILFSSKSLGENIEGLKGFKQLAEITVYYIRKGVEIPEEQLGKEVTVTYQVENEGKVEVVKKVTLIAGQSIDGYIPEEITYYCKKNGLLWDLNVNNAGCTYDGPVSDKEMITEDKVYTFKTNKAIRFIAIEYMSDYLNNIWTMEIYAMSFDDLPFLSQKHLYVPDNVYVNYNVVRLDGMTYSMGTNEKLYKYDSYMHGTYGYETGVALASFTGTKDEVKEEYIKMRNNEGVFANYNEYFTYTLQGEYQKGLLTVTFYDNFGNYSRENVVFEGKYLVPNYWITNMNNTAGLRFVGWDTNDDGKVDILPDEEFVVTSNMILKPVMTRDGYTITITDAFGVTKVYNLNYGDMLSQEILSIINNSPLIQKAPNENSFYEESYWRICTNDFVSGDNDNPYFKGVPSAYYGDISKMPACDLTFQAVKGELYHYITYTDETGGYFIVTNEDGTYSNLKTVKFAVKDGEDIITSSSYGKIKYIPPKDTEEIKYLQYQFLDENDNLMLVSGSPITSPKTYHISWWKVLKNSHTIEFAIYIYDQYGNIIEQEIIHNDQNLRKEKYEELVSKYNEEFEYYRSSAYYEKLGANSNYMYRSYANGTLDISSSTTNEPTGEMKMVYKVCVQRIQKQISYTLSFVVDGKEYTTFTTNGSEEIQLPGDPSKDGYVFDGWYFDEGTWSKPFKATSLVESPIKNNISVYAKFTAAKYIITYETNGGVHNNSTSYTVDGGFVLTDAIKNGYAFDGWYNGETKVTEIANGTTGNLTLVAKWNLITYTISFRETKDALNTNPTSYTIESDTIKLINITTDGFIFKGWYTDSEYKNQIIEISSGSYGDIVLYAKWINASDTPIGMTEEEWKNVFSSTNCTMEEYGNEKTTYKYDGNKMYTEISSDAGIKYFTEKITDDSGNTTYWVYVQDADGKWIKYIDDGVGSSKNSFENLDNYFHCISNIFSKVTYDAENNSYVAQNIDLEIANSGGIKLDRLIAKVVDGKISEVTCMYVMNGAEGGLLIQIAFMEIGSTTVTIPNVSN